MRVVHCFEHGGPEGLRIDEVALPVPAPGKVRLRTEADRARFVIPRFPSRVGRRGPAACLVARTARSLASSTWSERDLCV
jgi:hypothetical protein